MNSLGAGGAQKPFLVNAANALVFGLMGFFCLFGGPIANRIGLKWTLVLGAVGYPVYSAGLYTNNRYVCFDHPCVKPRWVLNVHTGKCLVRPRWCCGLWY